MSIHYLNRFQQAKPAGFDGVFEWDFLIPCFHRNNAIKQIEPMDFDAVVERKGHFLVYETKEPGRQIPDGQRLTLETFVRTGHATVICIQGKTQEQIGQCELWHCVKGEIQVRVFDGKDELVRQSKRWFDWANK